MADEPNVDFQFLDELRLRVEGGNRFYPFIPLEREQVQRLFKEVDKIESAMIAARATAIRLQRELGAAADEIQKLSYILGSLDINPDMWQAEEVGVLPDHSQDFATFTDRPDA